MINKMKGSILIKDRENICSHIKKRRKEECRSERHTQLKESDAKTRLTLGGEFFILQEDGTRATTISVFR